MDANSVTLAALIYAAPLVVALGGWLATRRDERQRREAARQRAIALLQRRADK